MRTLSFAEDLCLLLLDDSSGALASLPGRTQDFGFATVALLELAQSDRIDTDLETLILVDPTPLGDETADPALKQVTQNPEPRSPEYWVRRIGLSLGGRIAEAALDKLCARGILERGPGDDFSLVASVARSKRYPGIEGRSADEVQVRIMRILFSGDVRDPWDADLIGLLHACRIFERILTRRELEQVRDRIESMRSLNLLCRAARLAIDDDIEKRKPTKQQYKPIPNARGVPLLGNALAMAGDMNAALIKAFRRHGPIFRLRLPNRKPVVLAGRAANAFAMKKGRTHLRSKREFHGLSQAMEADNTLVSLDGPDHIKLRRTAQAGYGRAVIENRIDEAIDIVRRIVRSWSLGVPISTFAAFQKIVSYHLGVLATGRAPHEYLQDLKYYLDSLLFAARRDRPKFMYNWRIKRVRHRIRQLCADVVELHEPGLRQGSPPDVIDAFLELHRREPALLSKVDLQAALVGPYIAALDTVAGTLGFAFLKLLNEPRYMEALRAEFDDLFANGMPDAKAVRGLDMTHAFVTETLRCYPVTPAILRTAINSFDFEGHRVPAGTPIMVATGIVHVDAGYYPNPERFEPERHLPPRLEYKQKGAFAPFGIGPHTCLGGAFAQVQMAATLATMVHYAEFQRVHRTMRKSSSPKIRMTTYPSICPHKSCCFRVVRHLDRQPEADQTESDHA